MIDEAAQAEQWMQRALELAARGRGFVEPNPMVGCVIVGGQGIIGEGWHKRFGGPHAEREAIAACTTSPAGATAYVTLEPCCHTNKKTPPCVPSLIEVKIARVVVACADPNVQVCGNGLRQLREAGIEVEADLLNAHAKQLNAPFFKSMLHRRSYVTLKWAQTADGKVAGPGGQPMHISNQRSLRTVHELRAKCDAIVAGINTVLTDDPQLTARVEQPPRTPLRVILDTHLRIPTESNLVRTARETPLTIYSSAAQSSRADQLRGLGVQVLGVETRAGLISLDAVLESLHEQNMTHVLVEPGPTLARSFIDQNLADRVWVYQSQKRIDSPTAPAAPKLDWPISAEIDLDGDRLIEMLNPRSPAFFHLAPSPDFPL